MHSACIAGNLRGGLEARRWFGEGMPWREVASIDVHPPRSDGDVWRARNIVTVTFIDGATITCTARTRWEIRWVMSSEEQQRCRHPLEEVA